MNAIFGAEVIRRAPGTTQKILKNFVKRMEGSDYIDCLGNLPSKWLKIEKGHTIKV